MKNDAIAPAVQPTMAHRRVARMRLFMPETVRFGGPLRQRTFVLIKRVQP
jgi:hypothetical protein